MQFDFFSKLTEWIGMDPAEARIESFAVPKPKDASLTARARKLLVSAGCARLARRVIVKWNPRMRSTAGVANYGRSLVTLNPILAQFGEEEIDKTLRHELAHLLAHDRAGRRRIAPHGPEWKKACRDLGLENETRCHNLPLPRRKVRARHTYHCSACNTDIKRVRPFRGRVACLACCKAHNNGIYHEKFRLTKANDEARMTKSERSAKHE